jgi:hypothetical protein
MEYSGADKGIFFVAELLFWELWGYIASGKSGE